MSDNPVSDAAKAAAPTPECDAFATIPLPLNAGETIDFTKALNNWLAFARTLERQRNALRAELAKVRGEAANWRAKVQVCEVCWTNSYEYCEATDEGATPYKDGSGFVSCSMCRLTDALRKALADRARLEADNVALLSSLRFIKNKLSSYAHLNPGSVMEQALAEANNILEADSDAPGDELRGVLAQAHGELSEYERSDWDFDRDLFICPTCRSPVKRDQANDGHAQDCKLAATLAALSRFLPIGEALPQEGASK